MFTPGFRLFFGFAAVAVAAAAIYGVSSGSAGETEYFAVLNVETWVGVLSLGYKGGIGDHVGYVVLMGFAVLSALVAVFLVAFRDADAESVGELMDDGQTPEPQGDLEANYWPAVAAFASSARAPVRMPSMPMFPSWQAYSKIASSVRFHSSSAVQGAFQTEGSLTVNS